MDLYTGAKVSESLNFSLGAVHVKRSVDSLVKST